MTDARGTTLPVFHWRHNITFQRVEGGDVIIRFGGLDFLVPAAEWCSIITHVSEGWLSSEEPGIAYYNALEFHGCKGTAHPNQPANLA